MTNTNRIVQYVKDSKEELKHVTWPSKTEVRRHTILVIAVSLGMAAMLGLIDYILNLGIEKIIIK